MEVVLPGVGGVQVRVRRGLQVLQDAVSEDAVDEEKLVKLMKGWVDKHNARVAQG